MDKTVHPTDKHFFIVRDEITKAQEELSENDFQLFVSRLRDMYLMYADRPLQFPYNIGEANKKDSEIEALKAKVKYQDEVITQRNNMLRNSDADNEKLKGLLKEEVSKIPERENQSAYPYPSYYEAIEEYLNNYSAKHNIEL